MEKNEQSYDEVAEERRREIQDINHTAPTNGQHRLKL